MNYHTRPRGARGHDETRQRAVSPLVPLGFECSQHRRRPRPSVERILRKALVPPRKVGVFSPIMWNSRQSFGSTERLSYALISLRWAPLAREPKFIGHVWPEIHLRTHKVSGEKKEEGALVVAFEDARARQELLVNATQPQKVQESSRSL